MISVEKLKNYVLISEERVKFSQVDPYGHLNSARYLEFMADHRIVAAEQHLQCFTLDMLRDLSVGFAIVDAHISFCYPSICGELLEISSWVKSTSNQGFSLRVVIANAENRKVKAIGNLEFRSIRSSDGRPAPMPDSLPSRSEHDLLSKCPTLESHLTTLKFRAGFDL